MIRRRRLAPGRSLPLSHRLAVLRAWWAKDYHRMILALTDTLADGLTTPRHPQGAAALAEAWGRLGCHGLAVETAEAAGLLSHPERLEGHSPVSVLTGLTALGRQEEALRLWQALAPHMPPVLLRPLAEGLCPYAPSMALTVARAADLQGGLRAALEAAVGSFPAARALVEATPPTLSEGWLLRAELGLVDPLAALNDHLSDQGLTRLALIDPGAPLSAGTLVAATAPPASGAQGPLISVLMPAYRTAGRIGPAIQSLLEQTHRALDVVVVDDASPDGTWAEIQAKAAQDSRVRAFRLETNSGPYVARNRALAEARGAFITVHDSDDYAHPERLARQLATLEGDRRLQVVSSHWVRLTDDGHFVSPRVWPLATPNPASPLFRRAVVDRAGIYDPVRFGADTEYQARLRLLLGRDALATLPLTLTLGAHRDDSLTRAADTGRGDGAMNRERLAYWQEWTVRHLRWVAGAPEAWPRG